MRFLFALASLVLFITAVYAQNPERPWLVQNGTHFWDKSLTPDLDDLSLTPEQIAECRAQVRRRGYPCDDTRGCFNPTSEQLATAEKECRFQSYLQRRANEAREKLLEAERQKQNQN
jgi:hypothetical protein